MNDLLKYAYDACRLLHLALGRNNTPLSSEEYGQLFHLFRTDEHFAQVVRECAKGQGLSIYAAHDEYGLLLVNMQDGFFTPGLTDFQEGMSAAERLGYGLLFYVVAAYVYPTAESVAEDFGRELPVRLSALVAYAREQLALAKGAPLPRENERANITLAAEYLLRLPEGGRRAQRRSLRGMLEHILDYYVEHGLFTREESSGIRNTGGNGAEPGEPAVVYRPRARYRVQVRFMVNEGATALMEFLRQTPTPPCPS